MQNVVRIARMLGQLSFVDVMNELMINRPDRMIAEINQDTRMRIHLLEMMVAAHSDSEIIDMLAPWDISISEDQVKALVSAIRLCVQRRHPEWGQAKLALRPLANVSAGSFTPEFAGVCG